MILVDTSAWINYLSDKGSPSEHLDGALARGWVVGLTSVVYQEILQGAKTHQEFMTLQSYLGTYPFYSPKDAKASYAAAAKLYARCRSVGVTIRSTIDCLIAQVAIEHGLLLLHADKDFPRIADVTPELRLFERVVS